METQDIIQGSALWHEARCGSIGATAINDIMSTGKGGAESAGRKNYRAAKVCERLTGLTAENYVNAAMQRGTDLEPMARDAYSFLKGVEVAQVGLIKHPRLSFSHASPDGLIGDDGMIEIKVPSPANHIEYLLAGEVPSIYVKQLQWQMACTGRKWNDFCSYCPELPEEMQLFIKRLDRDDKLIAEMESAVFSFNDSVEQMIAELKAIKA
ncbi:MAG: YqaJ viral recombinase family protein [Desulfobulbaceae bacterium]|nr:YqaJ viral recombinase family protein [Desulfobulbaceae bacterium]